MTETSEKGRLRWQLLSKEDEDLGLYHPDNFVGPEEMPHLWAHARWLARNSIIFILQALYPKSWHTFDFEDIHLDMCWLLSHRDNVHIEVPRDHRKTTLVIARLIQRFFQDPDRRIIYCSKTPDLANDVSRMVRGFFGNSFTKNYFPEYHIANFRTTGEISGWYLPARENTSIVSPSFITYGLGNTIAGFRADDIVMDDPIDRKSCVTPKSRQDSMVWVTDVYQLQESQKHYEELGKPRGQKIMTLTPWDNDDVGARIMKTKTYTHYIRHCWESETEICEECPPNAIPHGKFDEDNGKALFPKMWDAKALHGKKAELLADPELGLETWYHQYGVVRRNPGTFQFQAEWFPRLDPPSSIRGLRGYVTGDSAWKDTTQPGVGDYSWFWQVVWDREGNLWVLDSFRSNKLTAKEGADQIVAMLQNLKRRGASATLVYQKVGETTWPGDVEAECRRLRVPYIPIPINIQGKSKWDRGLRLAGPAERGQIIFSSRVPEALYDIFIKEITNAPYWPNDDGWDGLANMFHPDVRTKNIKRLSAPENPWASLEPAPVEPRRSLYSGW